MTIGVANIGCMVRGCANPVIGQCTGYKGACGRFYCADHSVGTFCADCASRKMYDEIAQKTYDEYLEVAKSLPSKVFSIGETRAFVISIMSLSLISLIILFGLQYLSYAIGVVASSLVCALSILSLGTLLIWGNVELSKRMRIKAGEIDQAKPGFLEFYKARQIAQKKQAIKMGLAVAGIAAAAVAAGVASSVGSSDEERIRNAVDDELRRRGH